jgi:hypothetical protein
MSSALQVINGQQKSIDQVVICEFEKVSGIATDWGTVISDELEIGRPERAQVVEACFLLLLPEYEWTAPDMTLLQSLDTVEEWIQVFEGLCDDQGAPEEPMFTFNF